ncbi:MAG TPA: gliding motility-associated C-terminal domain-containing protein [Proteiniphilum sp.]|nr:gliding motility-associated C-terminal domain-containing protein [Proteiniphilum sp.]
MSINNGCESTRTAVTATINSSPAPPSTVSGAACGASSISLQANGGNAGEYRWYTQSTGGTAIADETNSSYTTPIISTTTNYYVGIDNGTCESERTLVVATINTIPGAPSVAGNSSCIPAAITLTATGGSNGQYRWYTIPTGGNAIPGETNSTYTTPVISETTNYYVGLDNGTCESARTVVVATIGGSGCSNQPPVITASTTTTTINGTASFNLLALISDGDDNLDPSTLTIVTPPISNAAAQINDGVLIIDYSGLTFAGTDRITIGVCDLLGSCSEQVLTVEVDGNVNVYNGISPNGDLSNEVWIIENIVSLADTRENRVSIFNRWGDLIFEIENYDNDSRVFRGINKNGDEVSSGIYFYKIEFASGRKTLSGYLTIKK